MRDTDVLIWDVATDTVTALPGFEPTILPYGFVGACHSSDGRFELARLVPPSSGKLVNHLVGLASGDQQLGEEADGRGVVRGEVA